MMKSRTAALYALLHIGSGNLYHFLRSIGSSAGSAAVQLGQSDMVTVSLYLVRETEKAYRCSEADACAGLRQFWLPKSQIWRLKIIGRGQSGWRFGRVTIPDWLANERWLAGRNPFASTTRL
jgi:hypothetical protein